MLFCKYRNVITQTSNTNAKNDFQDVQKLWPLVKAEIDPRQEVKIDLITLHIALNVAVIPTNNLGKRKKDNLMDKHWQNLVDSL